MDSENGNRVFARGYKVPPPPLDSGAPKKPGCDGVNKLFGENGCRLRSRLRSQCSQRLASHGLVENQTVWVGGAEPRCSWLTIQ